MTLQRSGCDSVTLFPMTKVSETDWELLEFKLYDVKQKTFSNISADRGIFVDFGNNVNPIIPYRVIVDKHINFFPWKRWNDGCDMPASHDQHYIENVGRFAEELDQEDVANGCQWKDHVVKWEIPVIHEARSLPFF